MARPTKSKQRSKKRVSGRVLDPLEVAWLETKIAQQFSTKGDFYAAYKTATGRSQDPERQIQRILKSTDPITPTVRINFAKSLKISIEEFDESLRKSLSERSGDQAIIAFPGQVQPPPEPHPTIDDKLLSDYLTGVGFAQWLGSEDEWIKTIRAGKRWLKANPEDFYCRGMFLWSVLNKGNPSEMIEVLNETACWLVSVRPVSTKSDVQFDTQAWRQKCDRKIQQLSSDSVAHPMFVRWHMEDTLVRAAMMRYLRFQAAGSQLEKEFVNLARDLEKQIVMKWLFDSTKSQRGDAWVAAAVKYIKEWAGHELVSGFAWLCLLWFTGRQKQRDQMQLALEQSCQWLEGSPDQTFVRWAALWLAGLLLPLARSEEPVVRNLIEKSADWMETWTAKEDRLVRMGFLWLVGACGNSAQVRRAIEQTGKWLMAHGEDDFIRVAYLLFLIRRKGTPEQRRDVIAETRQWLRKHPDVYELTNIAVCLCESAPD